LKRAWSCICTNMNSLHPRIIFTKFDWFWHAGSREYMFFNFNVFLLFCYYLSLERGNPLHLYKLESPIPKDDLCQVSLKFDQWFRRSRKYKSLTDRRWTIRKTHLSFQLRWAKKCMRLWHKVWRYSLGGNYYMYRNPFLAVDEIFQVSFLRWV
jgi:hypothetical protein